MATLNDYLNLIPVMNSGKPNFIATLTAIIQPLVDTNNVVKELPSIFDIDNAVGSQLDVVGQWIGLSRNLSVPISGVYFSFDIEGVGFDQGVWMGPFDPASGLVTLDDETYRLILKIKSSANNWNGTLEQAQQILGMLQSTGTLLFMQDNFDMSLTIGVSGVIPSTLFVAMLKQVMVWMRPEAVSIASVSVTSVSGAPIFGFDIENDYVSGFDVGAFATAY